MNRLVLTDNYGDDIEFDVKNGRLYIDGNGVEFFEFLFDDVMHLQNWLVENMTYIDSGKNNE